MILCIADLLAEDLVSDLASTLDAASFEDGRATAGWHARLVKRNEQAAGADALQAAARAVETALGENALFRMAALPRRVRPVMFSRYRPGMDYGSHLDDAMMGGDDPVRTDISVTVFLSDPASYEGGELVIETSGGEDAYKLAAGSAILYPASTLHRVEPVRAGERRAAVTWVQSLVRDPGRREILFDLDTARRELFEREEKSAVFDLISKSYANLLRRWAEV